MSECHTISTIGGNVAIVNGMQTCRCMVLALLRTCAVKRSKIKVNSAINGKYTKLLTGRVATRFQTIDTVCVIRRGE